MFKEAQSILLRALLIVLFSAGVAVATNFARRDGIPLVADVPYDIFAPCKDSLAAVERAQIEDLSHAAQAHLVYVDARPKDVFAKSHVQGAINVPYSVLFGAEETDIERLKKIIAETHATTVIVYGTYADPAQPDKQIELGKPLAEQLIEAGLKGVKHVEGGLDALNKGGLITVQAGGE